MRNRYMDIAIIAGGNIKSLPIVVGPKRRISFLIIVRIWSMVSGLVEVSLKWPTTDG